MSINVETIGQGRLSLLAPDQAQGVARQFGRRDGGDEKVGCRTVNGTACR
jgi:hypothetical protein